MGAKAKSTTDITVTYCCDICGATQDIVFARRDKKGTFRIRQEHAWQVVTYTVPFSVDIKEYRCPRHHLKPGMVSPDDESEAT